MVLASILGWATAGFGVRCYQLGIQRRNIFVNFGGHATYAFIGGCLGYYFDGLETRQEIMIEEKKQQILKNRERLAEMRAANSADKADEE